MSINKYSLGKRKSESEDEFFSYGNTMELAFGKKLKAKITKKNWAASDSSDSEDSDKERNSVDDDSDSSCESDNWKRTQVSSDSEDESELVNINKSNNEKDDSDLLSPSPPPPVITTQMSKNGKASKSARALEQALKVLKDDDQSCSTPYMRRSGAKLDDVIMLEDSTPVREIMVKVICHGIVNKYKMKLSDMFFNLQDKIAEKENNTREKILLTLRDLPIKGSDTPKSIGYTVADIIECVIIADSMETSLEEDNDPQKINIKLQTKESHSKREYSIYKTDAFEKIVTKYCKEQNFNIKGLKVFFDGELVDLKQTPQDIDMDNDDILDLVHK